MPGYIIKTPRLGLRNWQPSDLEPFAEMNSDEAVMEYFPKTLSKEESLDLYNRLKEHFEKHGYTYFAAETISDKKFIGFIGLAYQTYEAHFTPCVDIGWRLRREAWGKGYATEGAKACLDFGFNKIKLEEIYSVTPLPNLKSVNVMKKIGMKKVGEFGHPNIEEGHPLKVCNLFRISKQ